MVNVDEAITGGVRIRRIINIPNDSTPAQTREFRYTYNYGKKNSGNISSGILEGYPTYSKYLSVGGTVFEEGSSVSLSHIINSSGLHIGYPEAVELHDDGGYEIHRFTSCLDEAYRDVAPVICSESPRFLPISSMAHYRGYPLWTKYYARSGKLLKSSDYDYDKISPGATELPAVHSAWISIGSDSPHYLRHSFYKNFVFSLVRTKEEVCDYGINDDETFRRIAYRRYNNFGQIKADSLVIPGQTRVTLYNYAWETDSTFKNRFYLSHVKDVTHKSGNSVMDVTGYTYMMHKDAPYVSRVDMDAGGSTKLLYSCSIVNDKLRPVSVHYSDHVPVTYLWGRDYLHPRAVIRGCDHSTVGAALGFSPDRAPDHSFSLSDRLASLRECLPGCEVTEYTYSPHIGIQSISSPSGRTQYYDYDTFRRLISINDTRKEPITSYHYSSVSSSGELGDESWRIRSYLDRNIQIIGSYIIYPDSPNYFWADIEDLNLPYRWSVEGTHKDAVKISNQGKYVVIHATDSMTSLLDLKLTIFDKDGNEFWSRMYPFRQRNHYFNMELEKISVSTEYVKVKMTITGVDPNVVVPDLTVLVNGHYVGNISGISGNMTQLATGVIEIPRDYNNDLYLINLKTLKYEDTWMYTTDELFSSTSQE